ncbi:MAG: hypothetical protein ABSB78_06150 [Bacteroidota bacterium]
MELRKFFFHDFPEYFHKYNLLPVIVAVLIGELLLYVLNAFQWLLVRAIMNAIDFYPTGVDETTIYYTSGTFLHAVLIAAAIYILVKSSFDSTDKSDAQ